MAASRPGGLAVYDLGLSSRVPGFESRPGRSPASSPALLRSLRCLPRERLVHPELRLPVVVHGVPRGLVQGPRDQVPTEHVQIKRLRTLARDERLRGCQEGATVSLPPLGLLDRDLVEPLDLPELHRLR